MSQPPTHSKPTLRLATVADLPAIARCWHMAFFDDELIGDIMHPLRKQFPEDVYWWLLRGVRERYWDWRHQFIVAVITEDCRDRVVGAADWRRIGEGGEKMELAWVDPRNLMKPTVHMYHQLSLIMFPNRAADPSRAALLTSAVANSQHYWTGKHAECWDLYTCGVHPEYQGRGVGKMLVDWGTQMADNQGVSASVICGEKNRYFYAKSGLVDEVGKTGGGGGGLVLFRDASGEHR